jgi:hypothetical protein
MKSASIVLSQGVSQMSDPLSIPLPDDLLNTNMMTIENLIEANEVHLCVNFVLAIDFLINF